MPKHRQTRAGLRVAAVIPALDEVETIAQVVARTKSQQIDWVIVADNGSGDGTNRAAVEAGAIVVLEQRRGYGYACAAGSAEAVRLHADVVVYLDADLSSPPEEVPLLLGPLYDGRADLVLGSRTLGRVAAGSMAPHQRFGNWVSAWLMRRLYRVAVTDLGPFRAIRTELLIGLQMQEMTYGWPTEMMVKSANRGATIIEVPVSWEERGGGKSKVSGTIVGSLMAARSMVGVTLRHAESVRPARWRQTLRHPVARR